MDKPSFLTDQFWHGGLYDACERITLRYKLHPLNQLGEMDAAVRGLLIGYVGTRYFVAHLRERINDSADDEFPPISETTAEQIARDIKKEVLMPIRGNLVPVFPNWSAWLSS